MSKEQLNITERTNSTISLSWIIGLASLIMVFLIWTTEIILLNLDFSLDSFFEIHKSPAIWIVDLLPLIALLFFRIHDRRISEQRNRQENFYRKQQELYNNYARHAELLGSGEYDTPIKVESDGDELGKSLQYLQGFLRATQRKEKNQSWISEGKDMISRLLRLYNKTEDLAYNVLKNLSEYIGVEQGAVYLYNEEKKTLSCAAVYAYNRKKFVNQEFKLGHGLVGQCAYEMDFVYRTEIPEDYITISSGILGEQKPRSIVLVPLISDEKIQGVMEFASIQPKIPKLSIQFLLELGEVIARTIYNLRINQKTEDLLEESTKMTRELQANEQTLRENAELMEKTQLELENSNKQLEAKVKEAENATGKLHWLLENASELISIYDRDMNVGYVSPSVKKILGYTEEEVKQGKDLERLTRDGSKALKELIRDSVSNPDQIRTIQYSFITKEGDTIFLESSARNMIEDPSINGIIVNSRDITESIRAQKEERLKTRMQSLSENSLDMILRLSIDGQFYYVNPVVEDYIGINSSKIINKNLSELDFSSDLKDYFERSIASLKSNPEKTNEEISLSLRMGEKITERIISFDAIPEYNMNDLETILFAGHDITEAKRIEKELQEKNRNIQDSINYSRKIQTSLLPDAESLRKEFPKSFLFYKPRDVISGDFPWYYRNGRFTYAAAVDCTGHGVPGSMLSFIAYFLLKDVIEKSFEKNAGEICDILHEEFRKTLKQEGNKGDTRDGMDIALLKINRDEDMLEFAGAHRPLYLLREGELTEYKGNRKAIGGIELFKKADEKFENHTIRIHTGDKLFFFSDGLTDQLGGPYGRKYSPARVRDLILENPGYTMGQYHEMFQEDFEKWMEEFRQLDDVLMMGIEF